LFAQRRNLWSPKFYRMVADIIRFNRLSTEDLAADRLTADITMGQYLNRHKLGAAFTAQYIIPMGAAIWSTDEATILDLPALFFIRFFNNHGLLSVTNRPQWYVLKGGSRSYVAPLTEPFAERVHLNSRIDRVERRSDGVTLHFADGAEHNFDQVVFACHSDQALALLAEPTEAELSVLGAMKYADNDVVLHTDEALLPKQKKVWAAWNYHLGADKSKPASLTYNMNILQSFDSAPVTFCVTLNRTELIDPDKIIARFNYAHPVFSRASLAAQARYADIGNTNRSHFCGAYWFNGFHEDGVNSALRVVDDLHNRPHTAAKHRHESERVAEHE
ncbi:MAG: FAD-dependent oxidoreductase, partial [Reinekea forsetii]|nr:FAD-dependent oxidoreductase [Reinekea forsetii]